MKIARPFVLAVSALLLVAPASARESRVYEHPELEFQFTADEGFERQPRPEDALIYEVADPRTGIHVVLWYTTTEQSAPRYLEKMADMKGLAVEGPPSPMRVDQLDAWLFEAPATVAQKPVRTLLAVIPCGKSATHPREHALFIVEIWCAEKRYAGNASTMNAILDSVRILTRISYRGKTYPLYPVTLPEAPELPSPLTTGDGTELVIARTKGGRFALLPVTVENGTPMDYKRGLWGKGRQLAVDAEDFPTLASSGLHSERELECATITGRPVAEITAEGRPGHSSGIGFLAQDEEILSVLREDNRLVSRLGLTHPQLAKPLFNVFNVTVRSLEVYRRDQARWNEIELLLWGEHEIFVDSYGSKGWQESLFDDEVLGYYQLSIRRELEPEEERYLRERYAQLEESQLAHLIELLSVIETGEMVPFYITRYGFYEGHTGYRADPLAIAAVFGLRSIPEIDAALDGELYRGQRADSCETIR